MYEEMTTDANNLYASGQKVRKSSPNKESTLVFMRDLLPEIGRAQEEIRGRTWVIEKMRPFIIRERGHTRKIQGNVPYDRMILHCYLDFTLEPLLRPYLIYDNYASQVGKGVDLARRRFKEQLRSAYREYGHNKFYVMLMDFRKFYDNVQHQKLYDEIMRKIPYDSFHEYMIWTILDSMKTDVSYMTDTEYAYCLDDLYVALDHIYDIPKGEKYMLKSLNIGNQASQTFSVFYPTRIDNYIRIVKGERRHGRYMDDTSIIHESSKHLLELKKEVEPICADMGIFLNHKKTQIYRVDCEFKYLNRIYKMKSNGYVLERLAPSTIIREERVIKAYREFGKSVELQFGSWIGSFSPSMTQWQIDRIMEAKNGKR